MTFATASRRPYISSHCPGEQGPKSCLGLCWPELSGTYCPVALCSWPPWLQLQLCQSWGGTGSTWRSVGDDPQSGVSWGTWASLWLGSVGKTKSEKKLINTCSQGWRGPSYSPEHIMHFEQNTSLWRCRFLYWVTNESKLENVCLIFPCFLRKERRKTSFSLNVWFVFRLYFLFKEHYV